LDLGNGPLKRGAGGSSGGPRAKTEGFAVRKNELMNIAIEVFSSKGYSAGTTFDIADRAGFTQPALYHYVGGKQTILDEICVRVGTLLRSAMDEVLELDITPTERLAAFIESFTRVVFTEREAFRVYVIEAGHLPKEAADRVRSEERRFHEDVTRIVREAVPDSAEDPWLTAQVLVGAISWGFRWYREPLTPEVYAASMMSVLRGELNV
jgi:AcrR family transcriptional regulator